MAKAPIISEESNGFRSLRPRLPAFRNSPASHSPQQFVDTLQRIVLKTVGFPKPPHDCEKSGVIVTLRIPKSESFVFRSVRDKRFPYIEIVDRVGFLVMPTAELCSEGKIFTPCSLRFPNRIDDIRSPLPQSRVQFVDCFQMDRKGLCVHIENPRIIEGVDRDGLHEDVPDVLIVGVGRNQLTDCRFGESRFRLSIEGCDFFVDCASGIADAFHTHLRPQEKA